MFGYMCIKFLTVIQVISYTEASAAIGTFGCDCFGELKSECNIPEVPVESFPKECSSLLYSYITMNLTGTITDISEPNLGINGYLDKLIATQTNVLIYCGYLEQSDWIIALTIDNTTGELQAKCDIEALIDYLNQHKGIKGLVLYNMDMTSEPYDTSDFTQNFKKYLDLLHTKLPDMEVGISLYSRSILRYFKDKLKWLDFKVLDKSIDFYALNMIYLNDCTDQTMHTGNMPVTGNDSQNTVDLIKNYLVNGGADASKIYYKYILSSFPVDLSLTDVCQTYYPIFCKEPKDTQIKMCADTIQLLTEKGKYAKDNGAGFIVNTIDTDDADGCSCQCGRAFPGFHALVDGYNGAPPPPPCAKFDRT